MGGHPYGVNTPSEDPYGVRYQSSEVAYCCERAHMLIYTGPKLEYNLGGNLNYIVIIRRILG